MRSLEWISVSESCLQWLESVGPFLGDARLRELLSRICALTATPRRELTQAAVHSSRGGSYKRTCNLANPPVNPPMNIPDKQETSQETQALNSSRGA